MSVEAHPSTLANQPDVCPDYGEVSVERAQAISSLCGHTNASDEQRLADASLTLRSAVVGLMVSGSLPVVAGCLGVLIQVSTSPKLYGLPAWTLGVESAFAISHVLVECLCKNLKFFPVARWIGFILSVGGLFASCWFSPAFGRVEAAVITGLVGFGGFLIFLTRHGLMPRLEALDRQPPMARAALAVGCWLPVLLLVGLFFL